MFFKKKCYLDVFISKVFVFSLIFTLISGTVSFSLQDTSGGIRVYVVADAHVGRNDRGEAMMAFVEMCNSRKPDLVLDLGDTIEGRITPLYDEKTDRKSAILQQADWLKAWNSLEVDNKGVALGNRDVARGYPLKESDWIEPLGLTGAPEIGGTKLQRSVIIDNGEMKVLVIITCVYPRGYSIARTLRWISQEILDFEGDLIIFANHSGRIYPKIWRKLSRNNINTPAIFLSGHYHGPDNVTRDARGYEESTRALSKIGNKFSFFRKSSYVSLPSYLVTPLFRDGIGAKFVFYPDGEYEIFRLDTGSQTISKAKIHHQTNIRVNNILARRLYHKYRTFRRRARVVYRRFLKYAARILQK